MAAEQFSSRTARLVMAKRAFCTPTSTCSTSERDGGLEDVEEGRLLKWRITLITSETLIFSLESKSAGMEQ